MNEFETIRIMDLVESVGEDSVREILSDFSCEYKEGEKNIEVEYFLQNNAVEFSKQKISITYFVIDNKSNIVG